MVLFLSDPKGFGALANKSLLFSVFSMLVAGAAPKGSLFSNRPVVAAGGAVEEFMANPNAASPNAASIFDDDKVLEVEGAVAAAPEFAVLPILGQAGVLLF